MHAAHKFLTVIHFRIKNAHRAAFSGIIIICGHQGSVFGHKMWECELNALAYTEKNCCYNGPTPLVACVGAALLTIIYFGIAANGAIDTST